MTKISKFFILLIVLLLFLNIAHAYSFDVKVTPIKDKIVVDDIAEFNISIQNNLDTNEEFTIKKTGFPFWDMYIKPLQNPITLKVPAKSTATVKLFVNPLHITSVDTYTLDTGIILERIGDEVAVPITIGIKSTEPLIQGYIPTVLATVAVEPEKIDPRNDFKVIVFVNNQNVINYTNLTLKVTSPLFKDEIYFPLGPKEDMTLELPKKFESELVPQASRLVVSVYKDDRVIVNPIEKSFEISEFVVTENLPIEQSFLKIKTAVKVHSNNPDYTGKIKVETTPFKNLFSSTNPRASLEKENGKYFLLWNVELDENKSMTVFVNENYRPIVMMAILVIILVVLYFFFRSPLVVRKSIANVGMSDGGISEAKVVVRVKNRSPKQIANIEVMDNVPHIANVEKEISIGSMQPHAILKHPKKGILIKWNIETLEPGDERVLSYKMKSRLSILGEFNLPAATARTKVGNKLVISSSNRVSIGG